MTELVNLTLSANKRIVGVKRMVDAAFSVHPDFMDHTSVVMMFKGGKKAEISTPAKNLLSNARTMTVELVSSW